MMLCVTQIWSRARGYFSGVDIGGPGSVPFFVVITRRMQSCRLFLFNSICVCVCSGFVTAKTLISFRSIAVWSWRRIDSFSTHTFNGLCCAGHTQMSIFHSVFISCAEVEKTQITTPHTVSAMELTRFFGSVHVSLGQNQLKLFENFVY